MCCSSVSVQVSVFRASSKAPLLLWDTRQVRGGQVTCPPPAEGPLNKVCIRCTPAHHLKNSWTAGEVGHPGTGATVQVAWCAEVGFDVRLTCAVPVSGCSPLEVTVYWPSMKRGNEPGLAARYSVLRSLQTSVLPDRARHSRAFKSNNRLTLERMLTACSV